MAAKRRAKRAKPKKGGRTGAPPLEFDMGVVEGLGGILATEEECASVLGCSAATVSRRMNDEDSDFCKAYKRGAGATRIALRRTQLRLAQAGDRTMLIWLGKQMLGQVEGYRAEVEARVSHVEDVRRVILDGSSDEPTE